MTISFLYSSLRTKLCFQLAYGKYEINLFQLFWIYRRPETYCPENSSDNTRICAIKTGSCKALAPNTSVLQEVGGGPWLLYPNPE